MEFHEYANIFPMLEGEELDSLKQDIREHGIRTPICVFEGKILDGRNRYKAGRALRLDVPQRQFEGTKEEALNYVYSENICRRHLTASVKGICTARWQSLLATTREATAAAQAEGGRTAGRGRPRQVSQIIDEPISDANARRADAQIGARAGVNRTYVAQARRIVDASPELEQDMAYIREVRH